MFFKTAVLKNFANFTGSIHRSCYVSKVVLRNFTLGLQRFLAQVFSCKFYEITKNIFFTEWLWATASDLILLTISSDCFWQSQDFQPATFLKKRFRKRCFLWILQNFQEHLLTEHLGWLLFKFICKFWEVFQNTSIIQYLWETTTMSCTSCRFSTSRYS